MINFFAKSVAATYIWKRYKKVILSTAALFLSYFIISALHTDYLDYQTRSGHNAQLLFSYVVKWGLLSAATALYYYLNIHNKLTASRTNKKEEAPPFSEPRKNKINVHAKPSTSQQESDPFSAIRTKEKLRSRTEIDMEKHS